MQSQIDKPCIIAVMAKPKKSNTPDTTIVQNKRARHDYFIQDTFEAGVALQGWEVKAMRLKKVQLVDSYVLMKNFLSFFLVCNVTPLDTAFSHIISVPVRSNKLLIP